MFIRLRKKATRIQTEFIDRKGCKVNLKGNVKFFRNPSLQLAMLLFGIFS